MKLLERWTDLYGCQHTLLRAGYGGKTWLLAYNKPAVLIPLLHFLDRQQGKGELHLLCYSGLTPLQQAVQDTDAFGVILLHDHPLAGGPAVEVAPVTVLERQDAISYSEGGLYPAWHSAAGLPSGVQTHEAFAAASAVSALGVRVWVTDLAGLDDLLTRLLTALPAQLASLGEG